LNLAGLLAIEFGVLVIGSAMQDSSGQVEPWAWLGGGLFQILYLYPLLLIGATAYMFILLRMARRLSPIIWRTLAVVLSPIVSVMLWVQFTREPTFVNSADFIEACATTLLYGAFVGLRARPRGRGTATAPGP
jgi:hypothetical protein